MLLFDSILVSEIAISLFNDPQEFSIIETLREANTANKAIKFLDAAKLERIEFALSDFVFTVADSPLEIVLDAIKKHVKNEFEKQQLSLLVKLPLIKNICHLANGTFALIREPYRSVSSGQGLLAGTVSGMKQFALSLGEESLNLTEVLYN